MIDKPPSLIFAEINDLRRFVVWSPWSEIDAETKYTYGGGVGEGSYMKWSSESRMVGTGSMTIVRSVENREVHEELLFGDAEVPSMVSFILSPVEDGTRITWTMEGDLGWNPVSRWMGFLFIRHGVSENYKKGMENLEKLLESMQGSLSAIALSPQEETYYIGIRAQGDVEKMKADFSLFYEKLHRYALEESIVLTQYPKSGIFFSYDEGVMEYLVALRTELEVRGDPDGDVISYIMPAGDYLVATHTGSYSELGKSHEAMALRVRTEGFQISGAVREEYLASPDDAEDPLLFRTAIYYPVAPSAQGRVR